MRAPHGSTEDQHEPARYALRLKGQLDARWATWFGGLTLTREDNNITRLTGSVVEQAALHGVLKNVRDLGMPLVSVTRGRPGETDAMRA